MQARTKSIVVCATSWIGDCVMSLPALREVRRLFPEQHLSLLVRPWVAGVFEDQGIVDEIIVTDIARPKLMNVLPSSRKIRHFHTALLFQNAFRAALTVWLAGIPRRIGYGTDGRSLLLTKKVQPRIKQLNRHQMYYYLDLLYQTGLSERNYLQDKDFEPNIRLRATEAATLRARQLIGRQEKVNHRPLVLLNPGAFYGQAKRWFTDRYAAVADRLIEKEQADVIIVGSSNEHQIAQEIQGLMKQVPTILTGRTDLPTLMGILHECDLLITNDSGPMHLAAALGTAQIALFGSTDRVATGPFSPIAQVIHKHVECSPCLLRECPIDLRCFSRIEVDEVFQAAQSFLSKR